MPSPRRPPLWSLALLTAVLLVGCAPAVGGGVGALVGVLGFLALVLVGALTSPARAGAPGLGPLGGQKRRP